MCVIDKQNNICFKTCAYSIWI